jgi:hypothetical protein
METDPTFLDATTQKEVIACLLERLKRNYIYPEHVEQIATHLVESMEQGEFTDLDDPNLFALALTLHLQEVTHDEHLWVRWHAETLPDDEGQLRLNPDWQEERQLEASIENYGFYKVERLPGNVGYLDIHLFHRPEWGGESAASAMNFITHTDALIIDLRKCTGGYPGMVALLSSYLFGDDPVHLTSIYWRDEDLTQHYWTLPYVTGKKYLANPVYVLTSRETFSGGELFANILQSRKRATLIGEKTDGGANAGASYRLHAHFEAFIPIGRTIDPLSGTNWEGCGIQPDILISGEQSLNLAYRLALQSIIEKHGNATSAPLRKLVSEAQDALKSLANL